MNKEANYTIDRNIIAFFLLAIFIFLIYINTFNASWHLDDYHNICNNPHIKLENFYPDAIKNVFFASYDNGNYEGKSIYRPVAMLSFALNWYWSQNDVTGYHLVNTAIHLFSAFFLYLTILNLLDSPNIRDQYKGKRYGIALASSVLWAIHPIQTQAVTYIVQRMASASAMFFLAALYVYIKARTCVLWPKKIGFYLLLSLLFLFAMGSKENAAMLPVIIILMEFLFFQDIKTFNIKGKKIILIVGILVLLLMGYVFFLVDQHNLLSILGGYEKRPYTLLERLMSESRVLVFYLYQLIYPVSQNFSIVHDIEISRSLFSPWTTLPSMLLLLFIFGIGCWNFKKKPVVCFAIGFYFLNHIIESTILPLELIFEHRNYLPSMFVFVPFSSGIIHVLSFYEKIKEKRMIFFIGICSFTTLIFLIGFGTYVRNFVWASEESLWMDAIEKAPKSSRPYQIMGHKYYTQKIPDYEKAIIFFEKAINLRTDQPLYLAMSVYDDLSLIYFKQKKYKMAVEYGRKAVNESPDSDNIRLRYVIKLVAADYLEIALDELSVLIKNKPDYIELYNLQSRIFLKLDKIDAAKVSVLKAMKIDAFNLRAINYFAIFNFKIQNYDKAEHYFLKVLESSSDFDQIYFYLTLIENSMRAGWENKKEKYIEILLSKFSLGMIKNKVDSLKNEKYPEIYLSLDQLSRVIAERIDQKAAVINKASI